ncbi:MAG: hypothetical protein WBB73_09430 [Candidatus Aminicenantaceae bacterium]
MCRLCRILYGLLPVVPVRGWLLRKHMADCPRCIQEPALDAQTARAVAKIPVWIRQQDSLWPQVKTEILAPRSAPKFGRIHTEPTRFIHWRYAVAGLSLAVLIAANLLIQQKLIDPSAPEMTAVTKDPAQVTVNFAEVKGKKAHHHIYQTPSTSYIWFVQSKDIGGE